MGKQALFAGLVMDEADRPVDVTIVGGEAFYVVDDNGFRRHIESEQVDHQVLQHLRDLMQGHEDLIAEGAMKMIGQEDIFTKAMIENQLKNMDDQIEKLLEVGIPEGSRAYLRMTGFQIRINLHGEIIEIMQPSGIDPQDE